MLPALTRGLRLALVIGISTAYLGWHTHDAFAKKHHDDDGESDDSGDDEEDGGGDKGDGDDSGEDDEGDDKEQPPVTAGGLFTLQSYPINELQRPLTMTQRLTQVRLGLGTDISAKGAFNSAGLSFEFARGLQDNFTLLGGFTNAYNMKQFEVYAGFEGALVYDLLDIRVTADVHRQAYPEYAYFCTPVSSSDHVDQVFPDPAQCGAGAMASIVSLPDGTYHSGDTQFSINLGFPVRYAFNSQIALVALQTLMKIDFNGVSRDHVLPETFGLVDMMNNPILDSQGNQLTVTHYVPVGNGAKPDLVPSFGLATNPIPQLSILAYGQFIIPDFDTQAGAFQIPVTLRIEASPSQQLDFGLAFTLLNVSPPDPQSPIDNRFLSAYVQARY
jgi:hypothetical protein